MKDFKSSYRQELLKDFWHHSKSELLWLLPLILFFSFLVYSAIQKTLSNDAEYLDTYIGQVEGKVIRVDQKPIALDNPRIRRRVQIRVENGDSKIIRNDTLRVDDVISLKHWKTSSGNDYYEY